MKRPHPVKGEIYHIYNRGVEKRKTFMDNEDRERFVRSLFVFNDQNPFHNFKKQQGKGKFEVRLRIEEDMREALVEILAFVLMPNHFHLMVKQITENGITEFMRKLGTGYTNAFNIKYQRVGPLFQGKYKIAHIKTDRHLLYLPYYIHLNPLDLMDQEWRDGSLKNLKKAKNFLASYDWSSHHDYAGESKFPDILETAFLRNIMGAPREYQKNIWGWLESQQLSELEPVVLESL